MSETDTDSSHPLDLRDPRQAGVYRVMQADVAALEAMARDEAVAVQVVDVSGVGDKADLLARIHAGLSFPDGWGRNWDALADGLKDLSWLGDAEPRLLVWHGLEGVHHADPELDATLCEILEETSAFWADQGIALWSLVSLQRALHESAGPEAGSLH